jgi:hypothetical protein
MTYPDWFKATMRKADNISEAKQRSKDNFDCCLSHEVHNNLPDRLMKTLALMEQNKNVQQKL